MSRHFDSLVHDLTRRIAARERGETVGYGETLSLRNQLDAAVLPWLAEWQRLFEIAPEDLTEEERRGVTTMQALVTRARVLYELEI